MIVTAQGQALRFGETLVRRMGRTASGVRAMRLKKEGDYIAGMEVVEPNGLLLSVTEKGFGKCTSAGRIQRQGARRQRHAHHDQRLERDRPDGGRARGAGD